MTLREEFTKYLKSTLGRDPTESEIDAQANGIGLVFFKEEKRKRLVSEAILEIEKDPAYFEYLNHYDEE